MYAPDDAASDTHTLAQQNTIIQTTCPECDTTFRDSVTACPQCGTHFIIHE